MASESPLTDLRCSSKRFEVGAAKHTNLIDWPRQVGQNLRSG